MWRYLRTISSILSINLSIGILTNQSFDWSVSWLTALWISLSPHPKLKSKPNLKSGSLLEVHLWNLILPQSSQIKYLLLSVTSNFLPIEWEGWGRLLPGPSVVNGMRSLNTECLRLDPSITTSCLWDLGNFFSFTVLSSLFCEIRVIILPSSCLEDQVR